MNQVCVSLDLSAMFGSRLEEGELDRLMSTVWGWAEFAPDHPVTAVEYGQLLVTDWLRHRLRFSEVQRHAILNALQDRLISRFPQACEVYAAEPDAFQGFLISWFDDRYMGVLGRDGEVFDTFTARWIKIKDKPRHTWVTVLDLAPLYMQGMQLLRDRQDASNTQPDATGKDDAPQ